MNKVEQLTCGKGFKLETFKLRSHNTNPLIIVGYNVNTKLITLVGFLVLNSLDRKIRNEKN